MSKRKMIKEIVEKSIKQNDKFFKFELQIKSKAFIEHLYHWYILGETVEQYDMT